MSLVDGLGVFRREDLSVDEVIIDDPRLDRKLRQGIDGVDSTHPESVNTRKHHHRKQHSARALCLDGKWFVMKRKMFVRFTADLAKSVIKLDFT
jgi:hypothetical protein